MGGTDLISRVLKQGRSLLRRISRCGRDFPTGLEEGNTTWELMEVLSWLETGQLQMLRAVLTWQLGGTPGPLSWEPGTEFCQQADELAGPPCSPDPSLSKHLRVSWESRPRTGMWLCVPQKQDPAGGPAPWGRAPGRADHRTAPVTSSLHSLK